MEKIFKMKITISIIIIWIILFLINKNINIIQPLAGRGFNKIDGQYYRVLTGVLLHNNLIHLMGNCFALYYVGYYLENSIKSGWFLIFGVVACIISEIVFSSIYRNANNSIGGSTLIFAFIGLIMVLQVLKPEFPRFKINEAYGNFILIYGIVSNIPILSFISGSTIISHSISLGVGTLLGIVFSFFM